MIKIIYLVGLAFLIISGSNIYAIQETENNEFLFETVIFSEPEVKINNEYLSVCINGETSHLHESGNPDMPVVTKVIKFPIGSKIIDIKVKYSGLKEIHLSKKIQPVPQKLPMSNNFHSNELLKESKIYESYNIFPSDDFSYSIGVGLDGNKHVLFLTVNFYPIRYIPSEDLIYYCESAEYLVYYNEPSVPVSFNDEFDLVIITTDSFSNTLQSLIDHKNNNGLRTTLKTIEEIYSEYDGRDRPEQIKYFVKDAIETWNIKYVLIVGDIYKIPIRMASVTWPGGFNQLPTDYYYADIYDSEMNFCNWDSNNNNLFSEYNFNTDVSLDDVDLYPDVHIGRIPCRNNRELNTVINKIITYETQSSGQNWFNRLLLIAGDTFPSWGLYEGEVVTYHIEQQMQDFESIRIWTSLENYNPRSINNEISNGAGFISYSGHGYEGGFGTSPPNEEERIEYYSPYLIGINNGDKLPIIFFDACCTATLDYNIFGIKIPCIAWSFLKKQSGGAVATLGSTRIAYANVNDRGPQGGCPRLNLEFFKSYEPGVRLGDMLTSGKINYINFAWKDYMTIEQFTLIGDPSLKVGGYSIN